jgi:hypothetical protein
MRSTIIATGVVTSLLLGIGSCATEPPAPPPADEPALLAMLRSDDPVQITDAARQVATDGTSEYVLDTMAELLMVRSDDRVNYTYREIEYVRALNWVARALGESKKGRYFSALKIVSRNHQVEKPIRKYCAVAAEVIGKPDGPQYQLGMVSLDGTRAKGAR